MWQEEKHPRDNEGKFTDGKSKSISSVYDDDVSAPNKVVEFVKSVKEGKPIAKSVEVGAVNDRERKRIEELTGEKLNATKHVLNLNEAVHILNRHGENGKADKSMADVKEFAKIEDTLHNFDSLDFVIKNGYVETTKAYKNSRNERAKLIIYKKRIDNNNFFTVEAISDAKDGSINIITSYQTKIKK